MTRYIMKVTILGIENHPILKFLSIFLKLDQFIFKQGCHQL